MTDLHTRDEAATARPGHEPLRGPRLGAVGWARWAWRQLTSMRTALFLLLLIAVAAIPGSMLPQRTINPVAVNEFIADNPSVAPWLDRLGFFEVFVSPWFSAIYLLLVVSLIGCIIPRIATHVRALRGLPPRTPRNLDRLPAFATFTTTAGEDEVLRTASGMLKAARFRLRPGDLEPGDRSVSAEGGHLRETGNIAFHLGVVIVVIALAWGYLMGWKADRVVPVGQAFANSVSSYDTFLPGPWVDPNTLDPFTIRIDSLDVRFESEPGSPQFGEARDFSVQTTVTQPGEQPEQRELRVNGPLHFGDASVFLLGNGYAPTITVRDAEGSVLYRQATPFLPNDGVYTSSGAIKVVGAQPEQLGFAGVFLPTAYLSEQGPASAFPDLGDPALVLTMYEGELFADRPQSVYSLDTTRMAEVTRPDGEPLRIWLTPGATVQLPDGRGSISMDPEISRWAGVSTRYDPGKSLALFSALLALSGLVLSLTVRRRRVFVRVVPAGRGAAEGDTGAAGTVNEVHVGGLARGEDPLLQDAIDAVARRLRTSLDSAEADARPERLGLAQNGDGATDGRQTR